MSRTCQFAFAGRSGQAEWSFDEVALVVTPAGGQPLVFPVQEMAGIAGDGYTFDVTVPLAGAATARGGPDGADSAGGAQARAAAPGGAPVLSLAKLGAEGPTLLDTLQRVWLLARAKALRLDGSGEGKPFAGMVTGLESGNPADDGGAGGGGAGSAGGGPSGGAGGRASSPPEPFRALLFQDVLVVARSGRDLDPVFLGLIDSITFDEATYTIRVTEWPGRQIVFSKLGKDTEEFLDWLRKHRQVLANEAGSILAATVPGLASTHRAVLAGDWPVGRLRTLPDLTSRCPGFEDAFRATWLANSLRKDEGGFLLDWAGPASCWLGCSRESSEAGAALLWLLAEKDDRWFLEALTDEDRATYHFAAGAEMPALVSRLLCAPQFSKEALYEPVENLTGDRADLAIAALFLVFLAELRTRFKGRVIHSSPESWRAGIESGP